MHGDRESELDSVKCDLRSVLISSKEGLLEAQLAKDFKNLTGSDIPFSRFGFKSLREFLHGVPDICRPTGSGTFTKYVPVVDERTQHLKKLIDRQKGRKMSKNPLMPFRNSSGKRNGNGLFTSCSKSNEKMKTPFTSFPNNNNGRPKQHHSKKHFSNSKPNIEPRVNESSMGQRRNDIMDIRNTVVDYLLEHEATIIELLHYFESRYGTYRPPVDNFIQFICSLSNQISFNYTKGIFYLKNQRHNTLTELPVEEMKPSLFDISMNGNMSPKATSKSPLGEKSFAYDEEFSINSDLRNAAASFQNLKIHNEPAPLVLVKDRLIRIINDHIDGIPVDLLPLIYLDRHGEELQMSSFGYKNLSQFLQSEKIFAVDEMNTGDRVSLHRSSQDGRSKKPILAGLATLFAEAGAKYNIEAAPPIGSLFSCALSHTVSPFNFYFQYECNFVLINDFFEKIQKFYNQPIHLPELKVDSAVLPVPCAVRCGDQWFRGVITEYENSNVTVRVVDIGAVHHVSDNDIKPLLSSFLDLPVQAVRACLFGVEENLNSDPNACRKYFASLVDNKILKCKCIAHTMGAVSIALSSELPDKTVDVANEMVRHKFLQRIDSAFGGEWPVLGKNGFACEATIKEAQEQLNQNFKQISERIRMPLF